MTAQAQRIEDTILGLKKATANIEDDSSEASGSEQSIDQRTNWGNKLKRKARFVQEGQLDGANGPRVYRRKIEHAGHSRTILSYNPLRLDVNGYELDDEGEEGEDFDHADTLTAEETPYSGIKLEYLLAPLTSAAGLPNHPTLSIPYISRTLTDMTLQSCDMVRREKSSLARTKQLLTQFRGDKNWVPCGALENMNDVIMFRPAPIERFSIAPEIHYTDARRQSPTESGPRNMRNRQISNHNLDLDKHENSVRNFKPEQMKRVDSEFSGSRQNRAVPALTHSPKGDPVSLITDDRPAPGTDSIIDDLKNGVSAATPESHGPNAADLQSTVSQPEQDGSTSIIKEDNLSEDKIRENNTGMDHALDHITVTNMEGRNLGPNNGLGDDSKGQVQADDQVPGSHRMTTRAQAQAASDNTASADTIISSRASSSSPTVHPIYIVPQSAHPDRDFGLPPNEAEETRKLLLLYVQKQEEICRGAEKLNSGLLQADRMRQMVMKWAKAEAHVGEMSDGEDWYDKDEWGLDEDLTKGHEEEEDDNNHGKKTRGRRA